MFPLLKKCKETKFQKLAICLNVVLAARSSTVGATGIGRLEVKKQKQEPSPLHQRVKTYVLEAGPTEEFGTLMDMAKIFLPREGQPFSDHGFANFLKIVAGAVKRVKSSELGFWLGFGRYTADDTFFKSKSLVIMKFCMCLQTWGLINLERDKQLEDLYYTDVEERWKAEYLNIIKSNRIKWRDGKEGCFFFFSNENAVMLNVLSFLCFFLRLGNAAYG